jgi:hypothetical protein
MWVWPRRPQSHHTHRETHRTLQPRHRGSALPISTLAPAFSTTCRLPASTHRPAQPAHPQQAHTARTPATHHSPTGRWAFPPHDGHPPPLQHAGPPPRIHAGLAEPSSPLKSCSSAGQPCISAAKAPPKSATRRRSPPPTPQTCTRHTKRAELPIITTARCAGMLGALPHRSEPAQRPCSPRNRKPFRAGGRVRPAGVRSGDNAAERTPNRHRSRRGRRSHQP